VDNLYADSREALIVALARRGDRDAFAELVRRRQGWLRGLLLRSCGDAAVADDLAQQAYLKAWQKLSQLRDPARFGPWLKQLALNEWLQQLRKGDALARAERWEPEVSHRETPGLSRDLDSALATLPAPVRLCVVLAHQEQMTHGDIARATAIPLGTVKSHVRRGSAALRKLLLDYGSEEA
jgi:RNA polymerase sigma-70 factor (ECF subfamily)